MTHASDVAKGLLGLLGNPQAIGEAFHVTADEVLTWDQITRIVAHAAGTHADIVHVPSDLLNAYDPEWGEALIGDKTHSFIFDNSKIKRVVPDFVATVPYAQGAREVMAWYDADPARQIVDAKIDAMMDRILDAYRAAWPAT
jgi:nucleoside-diphosphate-sugar epimerase